MVNFLSGVRRLIQVNSFHRLSSPSRIFSFQILAMAKDKSEKKEKKEKKTKDLVEAGDVEMGDAVEAQVRTCNLLSDHTIISYLIRCLR